MFFILGWTPELLTWYPQVSAIFGRFA